MTRLKTGSLDREYSRSRWKRRKCATEKYCYYQHLQNILGLKGKRIKRKCIFYTNNKVFQSDPPTYTPISSGIMTNVILLFQSRDKFFLNKDTKRQAVRARTNFRGHVAVEDSSKSSVNRQVRTDNLLPHTKNIQGTDRLVLCLATQPFCRGKVVTCMALMIQLMRFKLPSFTLRFFLSSTLLHKKRGLS